MGGLDRERRPEVELIVGPRIDLRLVDQHLGVAEVHAARPRVGRRLTQLVFLRKRAGGYA